MPAVRNTVTGFEQDENPLNTSVLLRKSLTLIIQVVCRQKRGSSSKRVDGVVLPFFCTPVSTKRRVTCDRH